MFAQDAIDRSAYRVSENAQLDSWTATYFGAQPQQRALPALYGPDARPAWVQPAPALVANVEGVSMASASIQERVSKGAARWRVDLSGMGVAPVRIDLVGAPGQPFTVRVRDRSYGLPAGAGPRPATMLVQPFGVSDTTTLVRTMSFH